MKSVSLGHGDGYYEQKRDIAFLENLNAQLVKELDASLALEKELRERIERLEFELETSNNQHRSSGKQMKALGEALKPFAEYNGGQNAYTQDIIKARKALGYESSN